MTHSDDPRATLAAVTCYLDESATDGNTPTAVVGGVLMNRGSFLGFDAAWKLFLGKFNLWPAFHMKDFGAHGRFGHFTPAERVSIFKEAVLLVNNYKIYSLAATLEHCEYREAVHPVVRDGMSTYGMCFIAAVALSEHLATHNQYTKKLPYVLDSGNPYAQHVLSAHEGMVEEQQKGSGLVHMGGLSFVKDEDLTPLQAADIVCWAVRRKATEKPFNNGFEPLEAAINPLTHSQANYPKHAMKAVSDDLRGMEILKHLFEVKQSR